VKNALTKDTVRALLKNVNVVEKVQEGQEGQEDSLKWGKNLALDANSIEDV